MNEKTAVSNHQINDRSTNKTISSLFRNTNFILQLVANLFDFVSYNIH